MPGPCPAGCIIAAPTCFTGGPCPSGAIHDLGNLRQLHETFRRAANLC